MTADLLGDFQRLIKESEAAPGATAPEALLRALPTDTADLLRLCAIPHEINPSILRALRPERGDAGVAADLDELVHLSCVSEAGDNLALHDATRAELFGRWLTPELSVRFREISARLMELFRREAEAGVGAASDASLGQCVFHQVGFDQAAGFEAFERRCRAARHEGRLGTCASLINMISEYGPVLTGERRAALAYHEGKLAADQHRWEDAERAFAAVLSHPSAGTELQIMANLRLGSLASEGGHFSAAILHYEIALELARRTLTRRVHIYDILRSLGEAYRDRGDLVTAERLLKECLSQAEAAGDHTAIADAYNSIGTLRLRALEVPEAIVAYQASLALLEATGRRYQAAQVHNNIGLALAEQASWQKAEEHFTASMAVKVEMGDTLGIAKTQLNLERVYRGRNDAEKASAACKKALMLFESLRHLPGQALAHQTLGRLYQRAGELQAAKRELRHAIDLFERAGDRAAAAAVTRELPGSGHGLPLWLWIPLILAAAGLAIGILALALDS